MSGLKELQKEWRDKATRQKEWCKRHQNNRSQWEVEDMAATAREWDNCAAALSPHIEHMEALEERVAKLEMLLKVCVDNLSEYVWRDRDCEEWCEPQYLSEARAALAASEGEKRE